MAPTMAGLCVRLSAQVPGPELFAKEPRTPLELWDAIDYLMRTDQAKKALPFLDRFVKGKPNDATLIAIRNRYGPGSILRLSGYDSTRPFAQPLAEAMVAAARKYATQPDRIVQFISELTKTRPEQDYAVQRLREAGADAVPFLVAKLSEKDLSAQDRRQIVDNMGRLDYSAVPALAAVLDSSDLTLAANAATALGMIGDKRAIPHLTFPAAFPGTVEGVHTAAQVATARLTGQSFERQARTPVQVLTDAAWRYHRHQIELPGDDPVTIWTWNEEQHMVVPRQLPRTEAEGIFGLRFAKEALRLSPDDRSARVVQLSMALEKVVERVGYTSFLAQDQASPATAIPVDPSLLSEVLKTAVADRKTDLAAVTATALGRVIDRNALSATGRPHPLVEAISAPGRRLQFAAAKAVVELAPSQPFPGASQVVPALARFLAKQSLPRAVVIDANPNRGSQLAGFLINLGYDSELEETGNRGFLAAAETADVEVILISYDLFGKGWPLHDTLANLKADARTAAIPIFIYGPINVQFKHPNLVHDYSGIRFLVQPIDAAMLKRQMKDLPAAIGNAELAGYAREATNLLVKIAKDRKTPLASDLHNAGPGLAQALNANETSASAAIALGDLPDIEAQRSLADVVLDPSRPATLRKQSATELVRSIQRFGPLISVDQEARLASILREQDDADVNVELMTIVRALAAFRQTTIGQPPGPPVPATKPKSVPAVTKPE
jgi:hypothetical protein